MNPGSALTAVGADEGTTDRAGGWTAPPALESRRTPVLEVRAVSKQYGSGRNAVRVLEGLDLRVDAGEVVSLVGPSGISKTTLLKTIAGLQAPTEGEVVVTGRPVAGPPREMALVFQDYGRSLMPWLTVAKNVRMPLRHLDLGKDETARRCSEALTAVGLEDADRKYPWQLSGGMQQRVAIARALAYRPEILVMDEPFASVDAQTRFELEDLTLALRRQFDMTILIVTHDIDEAVYLGDRVVVLGGRPASVSRVLTVDLPRDRHQDTTRADERFVALRTEVLHLIQAPGRSSSPAGVQAPGRDA